MQTDYILNYAMSFVGKPYIWGSKNALVGFDCSGFVVEILKAAGACPVTSDLSSKGLYRFLENRTSECKPGALVFYDTPISHVGFVISSTHMISASGGDSTTLTVQDAIKRAAFVKLRPINYRSDFIACKMPYYPNNLF